MKDRSTTLFLIALLAVLTFVPFLYSWYTTTDDVYHAIGIAEGWRSPWIFDARRSGRLQHVIDGQLMPLAYGWGIYWVMKAVSLAAIVANIVALFYLVRAISRDTRFAALAVVLFFGFLQNTWDHNLVTAYPFIINAAMTLFFVSVMTWWMALDSPGDDAQRRRRLVMVSTACYFISLFSYESLMVYGVVFPVLVLSAVDAPWKERFRRAVWTPHIAALVVFVAMLVLFRVFLYTDEGRAFNAAEQYEISLAPGAVMKVLERYGASAMPMHYFRAYRDLVNDFYLGYGAPRPRLLDIFRVFDVAWAVKAAIVAFLVVSMTWTRTLVRRRWTLLFLALVLLVGTNVPIAVTAKYQAWVIQYFSHGYLTAYLVFFGVVILLALVTDGIVGALVSRSRMAGRVALGVLALVVFVMSYGTDFVNAHVSETQHRMYDRWGAVDAWLASPAFKAIPDGSIVLAPSLWDKPYTGQTHLFDEYWDRYVTQNSGRFTIQNVKGVPTRIAQLRIVHLPSEFHQLAKDPAKADKLYYLKMIQERRDDATYLLFSKILPGDEGAPLRTNEVRLMAHAKADQFRVTGRLSDVDDRCRARVFVDGVPSSGTFTEVFGAHVDHVRRGRSWLWSSISSAGGSLNPESMTVWASSETLDSDILLEFGAGFYEDEFVHRWAGNEATLLLRNRSDRALSVDVHAEVHIPSAKGNQLFPIDVKAGGTTEQWMVGDAFQKHTIRVNVPPRASIPIVLSSSAPRLQVTGEGRNLVMMFALPVRTEEASCASLSQSVITDTARVSASGKASGG